jgi:hypothetical protein
MVIARGLITASGLLPWIAKGEAPIVLATTPSEEAAAKFFTNFRLSIF